MSAFTTAEFLHVLAVVLWIGGVFLLDLILAPLLERHVTPQEERLALLYALFRRFFVWVWGAGAVLVLTGYWVFFQYFGGIHGKSTAVWGMVLLGTSMVLLALYIFFVPFLRMGRKVRKRDWAGAAREARTIRRLSTINLVLAIPTIFLGVWAI